MLIGVERFRQRNVEIENEKEKFDLQQQEDVCHVVAQPTARCQKEQKVFRRGQDLNLRRNFLEDF